MERLTIPDEKIEGGVRRTVIDARKVKEHAMTIYWALKKYEDTGLTPEQIMELKERVNGGWIPVEERLPKAGEHVLVSFRSAGFLPATAIISENGRWSMLQGAKGFNDVTEDVIAWRPLPEPYRPKKESEGSRRLREREEFFEG